MKPRRSKITTPKAAKRGMPSFSIEKPEEADCAAAALLLLSASIVAFGTVVDVVAAVVVSPAEIVVLVGRVKTGYDVEDAVVDDVAAVDDEKVVVEDSGGGSQVVE